MRQPSENAYPSRQPTIVRVLGGLTLLTLTLTAAAERRADNFSAGASESRLMDMLDCPLWVSSMQRCVAVSPTTSIDGALASDQDAKTMGPDAAGIRRDTYYFLGLQVSVIGVLYFLPESVSGWSSEQRNQHHASKWWKNVTNPAWDEDELYINYILHPYWGAAYYVRARERGYAPRQAFWYSFLLSTMYEAGAEALFEPISIQDFFVTPIVGSWLGGYFMDWREGAKQRMAGTDDPRFRDQTILVLTDPLGNAADFIDRRLGREVKFAAAPFVKHGPMWASPQQGRVRSDEQDTSYGVTVTLRW
jgi:hypothetical protein